jgi:hypothetical protein
MPHSGPDHESVSCAGFAERGEKRPPAGDTVSYRSHRLDQFSRSGAPAGDATGNLRQAGAQEMRATGTTAALCPTDLT